MSRPPRLEYEGAVYHVIGRGNERRAIFRDDADRRKYLGRLGAYADRFGFAVYAYCLMTNHVHLAIQRGSTPLSRIMLALHGSYSQAFNRRHRRVGHVFQGRYKAFLVQAEEHLVQLVRYIHMNPVKARIAARPQDFKWSSDWAYRRGGEPAWLKISVALAHFGLTRRAAVRAYETFMGDGSGPTYEALETHAQLIKGDEEFAARMVRASDPDLARRLLTVERLGRLAAEEFGLNAAAFRTASSRVRGLTAYVGREGGRIPLCRTATLFAKHETTIVKDVRRIESALESEAELKSRAAGLLRRVAASGNQR